MERTGAAGMTGINSKVLLVMKITRDLNLNQECGGLNLVTTGEPRLGRHPGNHLEEDLELVIAHHPEENMKKRNLRA